MQQMFEDLMKFMLFALACASSYSYTVIVVETEPFVCDESYCTVSTDPMPVGTAVTIESRPPPMVRLTTN